MFLPFPGVLPGPIICPDSAELLGAPMLHQQGKIRGTEKHMDGFLALLCLASASPYGPCSCAVETSHGGVPGAAEAG